MLLTQIPLDCLFEIATHLDIKSLAQLNRASSRVLPICQKLFPEEFSYCSRLSYYFTHSLTLDLLQPGDEYFYSIKRCLLTAFICADLLPMTTLDYFWNLFLFPPNELRAIIEKYTTYSYTRFQSMLIHDLIILLDDIDFSFNLLLNYLKNTLQKDLLYLSPIEHINILQILHRKHVDYTKIYPTRYVYYAAAYPIPFPEPGLIALIKSYSLFPFTLYYDIKETFIERYYDKRCWMTGAHPQTTLRLQLDYSLAQLNKIEDCLVQNEAEQLLRLLSQWHLVEKPTRELEEWLVWIKNDHQLTAITRSSDLVQRIIITLMIWFCPILLVYSIIDKYVY